MVDALETIDASVKVNDSIKQAAQKMSLYPLKLKQLEAIKAFISGKDTFVSLPTGYGKSAIYAVLPLVFDCLLGMQLVYSVVFKGMLIGRQGSLAVVVSPLISLMMDKGKSLHLQV